MPFLTPNQQRQSTEGSAYSAQMRPIVADVTDVRTEHIGKPCKNGRIDRDAVSDVDSGK